MEAQYWNDRFSGESYVYGEGPNAYLKTVLPQLKGKTILFPGEGEGRNAVWAATQGWEVHAFDQSTVGQAKCHALAEKFNCSINYHISDVQSFNLTQTFDVVGLFYLHLPPAVRAAFHQKIWQNLKAGGHLIIEGFSPEQLNYTSGGPKDIPMLFTPEMLRKDFPDAQILACNTHKVSLDEGPYHQGMASVTRLLASKK